MLKRILLPLVVAVLTAISAAGEDVVPTRDLTLGSYINGSNLVADSAVSDVFAHEYGHTKQSKILGPAYMSVVGLPSFIGAGLSYVSSHNHGNEWYEVWSNNLTQNHHDSHGYKLAPEFDKRPRKQKPDWYYYATLAYYGSPFSLSLLLFLL